MTPAYRERTAFLLSARHGGPIDAWRRAHDTAYTWYTEHLSRPETWARGTWIEVVDRAEADNLVLMFREVGVPPPADPLAYAKALELEAMSGIDAAFPDARPAVARLKAAGHRTFLTTNATESNARGSLTGARLLQELDGVFTGERLNASKHSSDYWERIRNGLSVDPSRALVVDDRLDYLGAAAPCGFVTLLLDRDGRHSADAIPPHVHAILRNLAGLPHYVDVLAGEGCG